MTPLPIAANITEGFNREDGIFTILSNFVEEFQTVIETKEIKIIIGVSFVAVSAGYLAYWINGKFRNSSGTTHTTKVNQPLAGKRNGAIGENNRSPPSDVRVLLDGNNSLPFSLNEVETDVKEAVTVVGSL